MAANCCVDPAMILGEAGETAMEARVGAGADTLSVAVPLTPLSVAVMVAEPAPAAVASPVELMVATVALELDHDTEADMLAVDLSL